MNRTIAAAVTAAVLAPLALIAPAHADPASQSVYRDERCKTIKPDNDQDYDVCFTIGWRPRPYVKGLIVEDMWLTLPCSEGDVYHPNTFKYPTVGTGVGTNRLFSTGNCRMHRDMERRHPYRMAHIYGFAVLNRIAAKDKNLTWRFDICRRNNC